MSQLVARGVRVHRRGKAVVHEASFAVEPGEVVAILGPNGAGKSTLLAALAGDLTLQAGEIELGGRSMDHYTALELARLRAVMPQHTALAFDLTVREVVALGRLPHRHEGARQQQIVAAALDAVGATELAGRRFRALSGGEQQRVCLARALAQVWPVDAHLLMLDEPTASLDLVHQHRLLATVRRLARRGAGVLVVLHDLQLASQYADRLLLLRGGRLMAQGTPEAVLTPTHLTETYGLPVQVLRHPQAPAPLIITHPPELS